MRILLTSHRFWPNVGGTEIAVEQLATHFAAAGHEVTVATSAEPGAPAREERKGFMIRRFEMRRVAKFRVPPPEYRRLVIDERHDVVHLHGQRIWSTDFLYPHLRRARSPLVFTAHGFAQWHRKRKPVIDAAYYRIVLPRALRHVARVTVDTEAEREDLLSWGVSPERIAYLSLGYDPTEFASLPAGFREKYGFGPEERLLLYAGGFYANKRVDRLVDATTGLDATLVVLGTDADGTQASLEQRARDRGTRMRVLGRIPRADVLSAYHECDLFLLGSDFEGYGLVLLEAMAAGLPFVSMPCGAAPDLARTEAGVIVDSTRAMHDVVRGLLVDPDRRKSMSRSGLAAAPGFSWRSVAARFLALFEEVRRA